MTRADVRTAAEAPSSRAPGTDVDVRWAPVCRIEALQPERGVAALLGDRQVALFRTHAGTVHAIGNLDPFSGAAVLSRGIVGDRRGLPTVASPVYKQVFSLLDGTCFDDPAVRVPSYPVRLVDGYLHVGLASERATTPTGAGA